MTIDLSDLMDWFILILMIEIFIGMQILLFAVILHGCGVI